MICDRDPERLFKRITEKETPKAILFQSLAEEWWVSHVENLSRGTQATYKAPYLELLSDFGLKPVTRISAADINTMLLREKAKDKSYKHAAMKRSLMKQILDYAIAARTLVFCAVCRAISGIPAFPISCWFSATI